MTSHLSKKSRKKLANELWSILALISRFGLFKEAVEKCIPSGHIHAKETSFSTKRKIVKERMVSTQQLLPEKFSKFNSTLHSDLLIEC